MTQSAGITINFAKDCSQSGECSGRAFEVDPSSGSVPGDRVVFRAWGVTAKMISSTSLWLGGTLLRGSLGATGLSYYTEKISFNGEAKKQLKYPIGPGSMWLSAATPIMKRAAGSNTITMIAPAGSMLGGKISKVGFSCLGVDDGSVLYGTVQARYPKARYYKAWAWTVKSRAGDYWFYLKDGADLLLTHLITVEEEDETEDTAPIEVVVVVKEYTSEALLEGATVYIDDEEMGETDENGQLNVGTLDAGTHTIKIVNDGYVDSDLDDLENDSFVVGE